MKCFLVGLAFSLFAINAYGSSIIVLVPGFFNSLAPGSAAGPYFSSTIVNTLERRATVFVADNLSPVGVVAQNGELLATYLQGVVDSHPGQKITLITHSAGAFYAFHALTAHPNLPVQTIVTLAAPYSGSEFIQNLTADFPGLSTVEKYIGLKSLGEFTTASAAQLVSSFRIPDGLRVIAMAGTQNACALVTCAEAKYLSWILTLTATLIHEPSDGIIAATSALANNVSFTTAAGKRFHPELWSDINVALEHWEMVVDSSLFHLIGVVDTDDIASQQRYIYGQILSRLGY